MSARRALAIALACGACACGSPDPEKPPWQPDERTLRASLGIPDDAAKVIVFGQSSHLDLDWQKTFDGYYEAYVGSIFLAARELMQSQPRAFYSIAEMAFLEHHLAEHPEELAPLREAADRGALHIVGGGMTSPDTLLPETELLVRDFLHGITFAEDTLGMTPRSAWLPDSFGHGATAPDLLAAAGYDSVGLGRIDGGPTIYDQLLRPDAGPRPDSTAAQLLALGSVDFFWRGAGGARVLAHYLSAPGLYCAGDNIDNTEFIQSAGEHHGIFGGDDPEFTDERIDSYIAAVGPRSKTPYLFIPVGCDFQYPHERLVEYLDRYNARRYPTTGVWAVAAPFDDYERLVSFHAELLPEIAGELSPYFMGFYGSRAEVKRATRAAARPFFVAETFATALGAEGQALTAAAAPALRLLTRTDHHDFVTGTSTDEVVADEQLPLLAEAEAAGRALLDDVAARISARIPADPAAVQRVLALNASSAARSDVANVTVPITPGAVPELHAVSGGAPVPLELVAIPGPADTTAVLRLALADLPPFSWRAVDLLPGALRSDPEVALRLLDDRGAHVPAAAATRVVLANAHVRAVWTRLDARFSLTSLTIDGLELIAAPSFLLHDYADQGGLWRLGHEMDGCTFEPLADPADPETLAVLEASPLFARVAFQSASGIREAALGAGTSGLELAVTTSAAEASTRTVSLSLATPPDAALVTSLPGGQAERAREKIWNPTFWPAVDYAQVGEVAVLLRQSTGARMSSAGELELMAVRDARDEACEILGGTGSDPDTHRIEWRIERAASPAAAARAAQAFARPIHLALGPAGAGDDLPAELSLVSISGDGIVSALKPADRGSGIILRSLLLAGPLDIELDPILGSGARTAVDIAERDLDPLPAGGALHLDESRGVLASVRLE